MTIDRKNCQCIFFRHPTTQSLCVEFWQKISSHWSDCTSLLHWTFLRRSCAGFSDLRRQLNLNRWSENERDISKINGTSGICGFMLWVFKEISLKITVVLGCHWNENRNLCAIVTSHFRSNCQSIWQLWQSRLHWQTSTWRHVHLYPLTSFWFWKFLDFSLLIFVWGGLMKFFRILYDCGILVRIFFM